MAKKKKQKLVPCTSVHQHDDERQKRFEAKKRHMANLMAKYMVAKAKAEAGQGDTSTPTQYDGMVQDEI